MEYKFQFWNYIPVGGVDISREYIFHLTPAHGHDNLCNVVVVDHSFLCTPDKGPLNFTGALTEAFGYLPMAMTIVVMLFFSPRSLFTPDEGPVAGVLTERFGPRPVAMVGGFLGCLGLVLSVVATQPWHLMISFGVVTGRTFRKV